MENIEEKYKYRLVLRENHPENTIVKVGNFCFGDGSITFIAGPCAVENALQLDNIIGDLNDICPFIIRGGAYKLRTSPYAFQGLHEEGLKLLHESSIKYNLPVVSEITSIEQLPLFLENVDIIQVGARNMQNYELLKALGKIDKPILLKRGQSATVDELLYSAEYLLSFGNKNVILCERGIRTFETSTRNTLDLSSVCLLKQLTHLPVIVDPSHGTGRKELVKDMALASIACKADGIMVEVHNEPTKALSDGNQAIDTNTFKEIVDKSLKIKEII